MSSIPIVLRLCLGVILTSFALPWSAYAANEAEIAQLLIKLIQSGRTTVTENQDLINDPNKADKGFTADVFAEKWLAKFKEQTQIDLKNPAPGPQTGLMLTMVESGKEVVAEAQPIINKPGIAFKGFIPASWGRKTGEKFQKKTGIRVKLTATDYRFPGNKPDEFETEALRMFADVNYPKGKEISKVVAFEGRQVLRMMKPEYAGPRCLQCHGEPKGERDKTGMKKEGLKEGDLAGALSLVIPIR